MRKSTVILTRVRNTKNTVRYDFDGPRHSVPIPIVYVQKEFLDVPYPDTIEMMVDGAGTDVDDELPF